MRRRAGVRPNDLAGLRHSVVGLAMDAREQIRDPDVGECFLWEAVWVSGELRSRLDALDHLLERLSDAADAWTGEAIGTMPLREEVRGVARECSGRMPAEPWSAGR
ncbi:hypothetical protein [Thermomonospora umbrina]|uniref:Uncharacterized protein n=1 Tax=Thermomonospora umbrina TaxID=111806 RepID=A0A3D9SIN4_9ACTN|nr:hypothetical protein [Thermomonospora umbrina]REE95776.1 hypothetical protein DFJ69_1187 [Thermomonospora umbrina]